VNAINDRQPDVVLLAGDTFDGTPEMVIREDAGVEFDRLQSRYGAYAISGNHEYIGEREKPDAVNTIFGYMASHGVQPLRDSVALIDGSFYIAGRNDRMAGARKTIPELLEGVDRQLPVILLDHQPYHLEQAEQAGVDLQLSGHTHHGQMWPLNYITRKIYEKDWGFLQKGTSNFYVSCGAGTWGPPIRTAGYSEIVVIDLKFNH
jgi:predicted MPP superfamily phosphohydrolase